MGCQGPDKDPAPKGGPRGWHNLWAQRSCRVPGLQHGLPLGVGLPSPAEPSQPLTSGGQPVPPPQSLAQPGSRTRTGPPPSAPSDAAWGCDSALRNLHPRWAQDWQNRGRAGSQGRDRWVWGSGPPRRHHLQDTARRTSVGAAQPSLPHQAGTAALAPPKTPSPLERNGLFIPTFHSGPPQLRGGTAGDQRPRAGELSAGRAQEGPGLPFCTAAGERPPWHEPGKAACAGRWRRIPAD